jgi:hypothetical protein
MEKFKFLKVLIGMLLILNCNSALAGFTKWSKVKHVVVHDYGGLIVVLEDGSAVTPYGCDVNDQINIRGDHYQIEAVLSVLLSAFHGKSEVRLWLSGCSGVGSKSYPKGTRVDIR